MAVPKGRLVTPVGFDPTGYPLAFEVDANGYLKISIAASPITVPISQAAASPEQPVSFATPAKGLVGSHGYVNAAWQKNPIEFGYSDNLVIALSNLTLPAGTSSLDSSAVPVGFVWVVTNVMVMYVGTVPTNIGVSVLQGATAASIFRQISPVTSAMYDRQGWWVLKAGDLMRATVTGATLNDDLYFQILGFQVQINL